MPLGDFYIEDIEAQGQSQRARPLVIEPLSDIAVLGPLDDQTFVEDAIKFERFGEGTTPISLCTLDREPFRPFAIHIRTHHGTWIRGQAQVSSPEAHCLWVDAEEQVEGGTSGGPIINEEGLLVGIVSNFSESNRGGPCDGDAPRPHLTLPPWILRRIAGE